MATSVVSSSQQVPPIPPSTLTREQLVELVVHHVHQTAQSPTPAVNSVWSQLQISVSSPLVDALALEECLKLGLVQEVGDALRTGKYKSLLSQQPQPIVIPHSTPSAAAVQAALAHTVAAVTVLKYITNEFFMSANGTEKAVYHFTKVDAQYCKTGYLAQINGLNNKVQAMDLIDSVLTQYNVTEISQLPSQALLQFEADWHQLTV
jgi:hypothetical protein